MPIIKPVSDLHNNFAQIELYQKLDEAEVESKSDAPRKTHVNLIAELRAKCSE